MDEDKPKKLYIDRRRWDSNIEPDDFMVTIGQRQSNSVYHVIESRQVPQKNGMVRNYVKVYKSDLITMLRRDKETQQLITLFWYKR